MISIIFFGSFQSCSVQVLQKLLESKNFNLTAVITTPPCQGDRRQITKTAVHEFCDDHKLSVYPLENLNIIPPKITRPDFITVAGYGKLLPPVWLSFPARAAINMHPSLLPQYAGRFPVEWAILRGETKIGVSLVQMNEKFDKGEIFLQQALPLSPNNTKEQLYQKLFDLGGDLIINTINNFSSIKPAPQNLRSTIDDRPNHKPFYARQLTREDGFVSWEFFLNYRHSGLSRTPLLPQIFQNIPNKTDILDKMLRALSPWPGVWTITPQNKRLKILSLNPLTVQLEGKKPVLWEQIKKNFKF